MSQPHRTVVITGAGSGIGKHTALTLAGMHDRVFVGDIQYSRAAKSELESVGIKCRDIDVRRADQLESLIQTAIDTTGQLDVLVNNAGVGLVKQIDEVTEEDWRNVFDVNLKAAFFGCKYAIPTMSKQESGGCIVNIASNAGLMPRAHDPVYSISKMALVGLTKSLALCHSKDRIRVNCVCPGPVDQTSMIEENFANRPDRQQVVQELIDASPLARAWGRMVSVEEIAETIVYLASEAARMVTGTAVAIDGGKSLGVPPAGRRNCSQHSAGENHD